MLLVDDSETAVVPGQRSQWISIESFDEPYSHDQELQRVIGVLVKRASLRKLPRQVDSR